MVHGAPTPATNPSPGVLSTLLVHNAPRLAIRLGFGVPCIIETGCDRAPIPAVDNKATSPGHTTGRAVRAPLKHSVARRHDQPL